MSSVEKHVEDDGCLCQGKVPKDCWMDFQVIKPDPKTGKPRWKSVLRYHKNCPEHGLKES